MASRPSRKTITAPIDDDQIVKEKESIEKKKRSRSMVQWMSKPWNKTREREPRTRRDSQKATTLTNAATVPGSPTPRVSSPIELKSPKKLILDTDKKAERAPSVFQYVFLS